MSRYTGPANKQARRVGFSILENGKDLKRPYGPGQHGNKRKAKPSNYSVQLTEKQKVRFTYGLNERQFKTLFNKAAKLKGVHGENFLKLLESRLDNLVFRMGLANTRRGSRQLVNHGHVTVNGKKVDIPSYQVKMGDVISIKEGSLEHKAMKNALESKRAVPAYLNFEEKTLSATYIRFPERSELSMDINESLIVEFYSR